MKKELKEMEKFMEEEGRVGTIPRDFAIVVQVPCILWQPPVNVIRIFPFLDGNLYQVLVIVIVLWVGV